VPTLSRESAVLSLKSSDCQARLSSWVGWPPRTTDSFQVVGRGRPLLAPNLRHRPGPRSAGGTRPELLLPSWEHSLLFRDQCGSSVIVRCASSGNGILMPSGRCEPGATTLGKLSGGHRRPSSAPTQMRISYAQVGGLQHQRRQVSSEHTKRTTASMSHACEAALCRFVQSR
jgi:hypothetical protein